MKRIIFYISDVGWGHATRCIALIEELLKENPKIHIIIRNRTAVKILEESFKGQERVEIAPTQEESDIGWGKSYPIDKKKLRSEVEAWIRRWDSFIEREVKFLKGKGADLIISDTVPQAFEMANKLSIPSVFVSNFNWWDEYAYLFQEEKGLERIKEAYSQASWAFVLPLESNNKALGLFERTPLLARREDQDTVRNIRRTLIKEHRAELIGVVSTGGLYEADDHLKEAIREISQQVSILWITQERNQQLGQGIKTVRAPSKIFRHFLAASDFGIVKYGYSTASEAIVSKLPCLMLYRPDVLEDCCATEELVKAGCCLRTPLGEPFTIPLDKLFKLSFDGLSKRMENRGAQHIVRRLKERFL